MTALHNHEAEMSVLGSMILSERAAEECAVLLEPMDFYRHAHQIMFAAMQRMVHRKIEIDTVTLESELSGKNELDEIGGPNYILQMAAYTPSPSNSKHYARLVADASILRKMQNMGHVIGAIAQSDEYDDVDAKIEKAQQLVFELGKKQSGKTFTAVRELATRFIGIVDRITQNGEPLKGLQTGFYDLDKWTSGFYPGDLIIVGARPAMGKTSLALDFAINAAKDCRSAGKGAVAVFSLEMSEDQLYRRMEVMQSGVSLACLKSGRISNDEYQAMSDACEELHDLPLFIHESNDLSAIEMRSLCRRLSAEKGLVLVIVDYLQLMRASKSTQNRTQDISEIARHLKSMAKELGCPVVALSQLNRSVESREDKRPQLSDLRESGSIEAEADMVMLLYRDAYYKAKEEGVKPESVNVEEAEIIIAKYRNGPTGTVKLGFQPNLTHYVNLARRAS